MSIFLSAGHYPARRGVYYTDRLDEHSIMVRLCNAVAGYLDCEPVPTGPLAVWERAGQRRRLVGGKTYYINERAVSGDLAVELHLNSWPGYNKDRPPGPGALGAPVGAECWVYRHAGEATTRAAKTLLASGSWCELAGGKRGLRKSTSLLFTRLTTCSAVIIEVDFMYRAAFVLAELETYAQVLAAAIESAGDAAARAPIYT